MDLLEKEASIVLKGTHLMMQSLLPILRKQAQFNKEPRIVIISSMSAVRSYLFGGTHCAAKGAIGRYANAAMLELWKEGIYVTDVRPGGVDTGGYDNPVVQKAILKIDDSYNGIWRKTGVHLAQPISVGYSIAMTLFAPGAHVTSINILGKGQIPHESS